MGILIKEFLMWVFVILICECFAEIKQSVYDLSVVDIHGNNVNLEKYKGMVTLIVNVATYCGYTKSHYVDLVNMQDTLGTTGKFTILAFPCNQFWEQEPDTNAEIFEFARDVYKVNFPMFSKIDVIGENAHPVYKNLKDQSEQEPSWNFWKFLIDTDGKVLKAWNQRYSVSDIFDEVKRAVEAAEGQSNASQTSKNQEL